VHSAYLLLEGAWENIYPRIVNGPKQFKNIKEFLAAEESFAEQVAKATAVAEAAVESGDADGARTQQAVADLANEFVARLGVYKQDLQARLNRPKLFGGGGIGSLLPKKQ
jgi:hypothetical protein